MQVVTCFRNPQAVVASGGEAGEPTTQPHGPDHVIGRIRHRDPAFAQSPCIPACNGSPDLGRRVARLAECGHACHSAATADLCR